ncbi:hypothetical protein NC99_08750 [Sunxiuqinia dokdonensis]|uniref:Uncharacterized protein n=1 Tax=Sunxiuqinia dokdonensis TaxID=1409788 RepID=A0A0L8VDA4_9BACT|nr:hypothetical protein NC99_08750 [Sunxiuqinia dokdonensis]
MKIYTNETNMLLRTQTRMKITSATCEFHQPIKKQIIY